MGNSPQYTASPDCVELVGVAVKANSVAQFAKRREAATKLRRAKLDHPVHAELTVKCAGRRQAEIIAALMVASIVGVWNP